MGIPDHVTCLMRNLYASQEAALRNCHRSTDWVQTGKGVRQGCVLSPCLFNLYAEYFMWKARLDEAKAGIKVAVRNINNLRYADRHCPCGRKSKRTKEPLDESERGEWKSWLKIQHFGPITSWKIDVEKNENSDRLYFLGLQNHCGHWQQPWN